MPVIAHLARRLFESSTSDGISATAIGLIVGIGIVPVFILIWVVSWLFWCYPHNRSCCCTRRRKKQKDLEKDGNLDSTVKGQEARDLPEQPFTTYRSVSGNSSGGTRLSKADAHMSVQTVGSNSTVQVVHEPKPFV